MSFNFLAKVDIDKNNTDESRTYIILNAPDECLAGDMALLASVIDNVEDNADIQWLYADWGILIKGENAPNFISEEEVQTGESKATQSKPLIKTINDDELQALKDEGVAAIECCEETLKNSGDYWEMRQDYYS